MSTAGAGTGLRLGSPLAPTTRPTGSMQGADCFAYAALDATSTPSIDSAALGQALMAADEELYQPGPWPH